MRILANTQVYLGRVSDFFLYKRRHKHKVSLDAMIKTIYQTHQN